jgi:hypothetical protein
MCPRSLTCYLLMDMVANGISIKGKEQKFTSTCVSHCSLLDRLALDKAEKTYACLIFYQVQTGISQPT